MGSMPTVEFHILIENYISRFLGVKAVSILNQWLIDNKNYPYPDESTTDYLAQQAEISSKQVKKWFANKRVRSQLCCKTIHRNKRVNIFWKIFTFFHSIKKLIIFFKIHYRDSKKTPTTNTTTAKKRIQ
jgi:hypothetical protein